MLGDSIESDTRLHSATWDMHKAFNSVSMNLVRIACHRVGLPRDKELWLADIDIDGVTVLKSNHALNAWMK